MGGQGLDRTLLAIVALIALFGAVDAWVIGEPDLLLLFVIILVVTLVVFLRAMRERRAIRLRPDLSRWLRSRGRMTGEPAQDLADRAVANYRLQLGESPDQTSAQDPKREL